MERWLLQGKLVVVKGFYGVGKTALVREAADWLTRTQMYAEAHFLSCEHEGTVIVPTLEQLRGMQEEKRRSGENNILVVVDSLECILAGSVSPLNRASCTRLWDILLDLQEKKAGVLLTTTSMHFEDDEDGGRLAPGSRVRHLQVKGLRPTDAALLATSILESFSIDKQGIPVPALTHLLDSLDYHPLAIQWVLPLLEQVPVVQLRQNFVTLLSERQNNTPTTTARHRSLIAQLANGPLRQLTNEEVELLSHLVFFEGGASKESLLAVTGMADTDWLRLQHSLERVQLLIVERIHQESETLFLHFHPVLFPYLRMQNGTVNETLRERYIQHYAALAQRCYQEDKRNVPSVRAFIRQELPNFTHALELLLHSGHLDRASELATPICWFLDELKRSWEHALVQQQLAAAKQSLPKDP